MRVRVRGKYWRIVFGRIDPDKDGLCDATARTITIRKSLRGERLVTVLVHELMHAAHWDLSEEAVTETSEDIGRILHRLGFRRNEKTS